MSAISLLLLVLNAWLTVLLCNAENQGLIPSTRVDAEQDPMQQVTVAATDGSPKSVLFDSCFISLNTLSARFYSIIAGTSNVEYFRYVPDSTMNVNVPWKTVNVSGDIFACADAIANAGYPMFTYDGTACKAVNNSFDSTQTPACADNSSNAVFINPAVSSPCPYPMLIVGVSTCLQVFPSESYLLADASTKCVNTFLYQYDSDYDALIATLKQNGYGSTKFIVNSFTTPTPGPITYASWNSPSYYADGKLPDVIGTLYMNPTKNFLLEVDTTNTVCAGLLCVKHM